MTWNRFSSKKKKISIELHPRTHAHSVAVASDAFRRYVEENVCVYTLYNGSARPAKRDADGSAEVEAPAEL